MTQKPLATIVVDSNELQTLSAPLASFPITAGSPLKKLQDDGRSTGSYIDLLILLADQGYKIVIPEMVAYESGQVLASGVTSSHLFGPTYKPRYDSEHITRNFLGRIATHDLGNNIEICPATGVSAYASYLDSISRVMEETDWRAPGQPMGDVGTSREIIKVVNIMRKKHPNMGEHHAADIMVELKKNGDKPIFLLTSDNKGRKLVRKAIENQDSDFDHMHVMTNTGLLEALNQRMAGREKTIFHQLGFTGIIEDHWQHIASCHPNRRVPLTMHSDDSHHDTTLSDSGYREFLKPFKASVAQSIAQSFGHAFPMPTNRIEAGELSGIRTRLDSMQRWNDVDR